MGTSFAEVFQKKAGGVLAKARTFKHRAREGFIVDIPDGSFTAEVEVKASVGSKGKVEGVPIVKFVASVLEGPHKGKEPSKTFFCHGKPPANIEAGEFPTAEQEMLGLIAFLLPDYEVPEDVDGEWLDAAFDIINKRHTQVEIGIRNREKDGKKYQDVFFNKLLNTTDDSGDQAEAIDDPEEADYIPVAGDMVMADEKEGEWEVTAVSQSKKTANIKNEKAKHTGIPWSELTQL